MLIATTPAANAENTYVSVNVNASGDVIADVDFDAANF